MKFWEWALWLIAKAASQPPGARQQMHMAWHGDGGEDNMYRIRCAACRTVVGFGTREEAEQIGRQHQPQCPATDEQRQQALFDFKFQHIINSMLEEEGE